LSKIDSTPYTKGLTLIQSVIVLLTDKLQLIIIFAHKFEIPYEVRGLEEFHL